MSEPPTVRPESMKIVMRAHWRSTLLRLFRPLAAGRVILAGWGSGINVGQGVQLPWRGSERGLRRLSAAGGWRTLGLARPTAKEPRCWVLPPTGSRCLRPIGTCDREFHERDPVSVGGGARCPFDLRTQAPRGPHENFTREVTKENSNVLRFSLRQGDRSYLDPHVRKVRTPIAGPSRGFGRLGEGLWGVLEGRKARAEASW